MRAGKITEVAWGRGRHPDWMKNASILSRTCVHGGKIYVPTVTDLVESKDTFAVTNRVSGVSRGPIESRQNVESHGTFGRRSALKSVRVSGIL